jgi:hypothetical protein
MDQQTGSYDLRRIDVGSRADGRARPDGDYLDYDLRKFLERFRQLLQKPDEGARAELVEGLAEYGRLCEYANKRLRECFALTQRGQYSNAVALAERPPNLVEWCTQLPIPEAPSLPQVAEVSQAPTPTLLDESLASSLQESHDKASKTAENLALLHRLTLARAPLPTRLAVMRRLYLQDSNHPYLDPDIRTFERAWYKQALDFVRPLAREGRSDLIRETIRNIEEGGYLEVPPSGLVG